MTTRDRDTLQLIAAAIAIVILTIWYVSTLPTAQEAVQTLLK